MIYEVERLAHILQRSLTALRRRRPRLALKEGSLGGAEETEKDTMVMAVYLSSIEVVVQEDKPAD